MSKEQDKFRVVADIYQFLANFEADAIRAASKLPNISDNLRAALTCLYNESRSNYSTSADVPGDPPEEHSDDALLNDTLAFLTDENRFPSKQHLFELAKELGLRIEADAKTSRDRLARRIARAAIKDRQAQDKLRRLAASPPVSQTAGWVDVIRRGS